MIGASIVFVALLAITLVLLARLWRDETAVPLLRGGPSIGIARATPLGSAPAGTGALGVAERAPTAGTGLASRPLGGGSAPEGGVALAANVAVSVPVGAPTGGAPPAQPAPKPTPAPATSQPAPAAAPAPVPAPATSAPVVASNPPGHRPGSEGGGSVPPQSAAGGPGVRAASFDFHAGSAYRLSFEVMLQDMAHFGQGSENLVLRLLAPESTVPILGLQLWDPPGEQWYWDGFSGLWASGEAAGEDRFLAPLAEGDWHELDVEFVAAGEGGGAYSVEVDGTSVDVAVGTSLLSPGATEGTVQVGLFREGARQVTPELEVRAAGLTALPAETEEP